MRILVASLAALVIASSVSLAQAPSGITWAWKKTDGTTPIQTPLFAAITNDAQNRTNLLEATGELVFPNDKQYTITAVTFKIFIDQGGGVWNPAPDYKDDGNTVASQVVQNKWKLSGKDDPFDNLKLKLKQTVDVKLEFEVEYSWTAGPRIPAPPAILPKMIVGTWINKPVPPQ